MKLTGKKNIVDLKLRAIKAVNDNAIQRANSILGDYTLETLPFLMARALEASNHLTAVESGYISAPAPLAKDAERLKKKPEALARDVKWKYSTALDEICAIDSDRLKLLRAIDEAHTPAQIFRLTGVE